MISTVLFDLDGLLADTESLHCRAWQTALLGHGITVSTEFYYDSWVRQGRGISYFLQAQALPLDAMALRTQKAIHYARLVDSECTPMPGAVEVLDRLRGHKTLAVASSAWKDAVEAVLGKLGLLDRFAAIVTGSEVQRAKPFPDVFLLAAQRLGVPPAECVVVEDAEKGVAAAKAAGMKVIAVPSSGTKDHDFSQANLVVSSLLDITLDRIDALEIQPKVERANPPDLPMLDALRRACVAHMQQVGIDQWDETYPTTDHFEQDMAEGNLLILRNAERALVGCVTLDQRQPPEYATIPWSFREEPCGVVHRLMISPDHQRRGYAKALMQGVEQEARRRGHQAIRLDTFLHNRPALHLYDALGYRRTGFVTFRKGTFVCFERRLGGGT